jgi:hypothetical protein
MVARKEIVLLPTMKTKHRNRISRFMALMGFALLLMAILPHHHHEEGGICVFLWDSEHAKDCEEEEGGLQSCECNGHTIVFNSALLHKQASEPHDLAFLLLIPLHTLFDYIHLPLPFLDDKAPGFERALYAESLYSLWMSAASGFRAPPFC